MTEDNAGREPRWSALAERGTPMMVALIHWIAVHIGRGAGRLLLYPITLYFLLRAGPQRRASRDYLRRVLGREPSWRDLFRHIHCFAATILDRVYLLDGVFERFDVRVHGAELIHRQVGSGQGCLLLGSHLGSFEILRTLGVEQQRFPLKVLMDSEHNRSLSRHLDAINADIAATVVTPGRPDTLLKVRESLDAGFLVGTLADRTGGDRHTVRCRFLGAPAEFPAGPMVLAAIMQCPVILVFGLYRGGNRYEVHFERFAERIELDRGTRQRDLLDWTQRYVQRLEHYTRRAPYNWFNFYPFWAVSEPDRADR